MIGTGLFLVVVFVAIIWWIVKGKDDFPDDPQHPVPA